MAKFLRLDVAQLTDVGRKREHNEDNMAYVIPKDPLVMARKGALFLVADGMGGHAAGEVASEIAVDTVSNAYYQDDDEDVATSLLHAIRRANASIHQRAAENMLRSGMGTTCVSAVLRGSMGYIANVGDSRAYLVRRGQVKQVSQDHSWVAEQVRAGLLTEEQARTHAQRNVITRCLGTQAEVEIDVFREQLEVGDSLILCTDGLSGLVSDEELLRIVEQFVPQESVYHLVERANENGGSDNITAIVVRVQELGIEPQSVRHPVPVGGGREVGEDATTLIMPPTGLVMPARNGEAFAPGNHYFTSGPLVSPDSDTAPQPVLPAGKTRSRLFYPTLVLVVLLILAAGGGGLFYFLHTNESALVNSALNNTASLIQQATGEATSNPTQALRDLSNAQKTLRDLQKNHPLNADQQTRMNGLQTTMVTQVQGAIHSYNSNARIALLPCTGTFTNGINDGSTGTHTQSIASVLNGNASALYGLGSDGKIYHLAQNGGQYGMVNSFNQPADTATIGIAGNGKTILTLEEQLKNNIPSGYAVNLLRPTASGALQSAPTVPIAATLTPDGTAPALIGAWGANVYVVLTSKTNPNTAYILTYTVDKNDHFSAPQQTKLSVTATIISVAAFPTQLFLLLSDGEVLGAQTTNGLPALPAPVLAQTPIAPPLSSSAQQFTASTDVPTVLPTSQKGSTSLTVPGASTSYTATLASGLVSGTPHLFIGDPGNHRILDMLLPLATSSGPATPGATPTSTGNTAGKSVALDVSQQYVSSTYFSTVKSAAVDAKGTSIYALSQNGAGATNLIAASTGTQTGCVS